MSELYQSPKPAAERPAANPANDVNSARRTSPARTLKSARNARLADSLAGIILIKGENRDLFNAHVGRLHEHFQPADIVEHMLLDAVIVAGWRQLRLSGMQRAVERKIKLQGCFVGASRLTEGFIRDNRRYNRQYRLAVRNLIEVQDRIKKITKTKPPKATQTTENRQRSFPASPKNEPISGVE